MPGRIKFRAVIGLPVMMLIAASVACNASLGGSSATAVAQAPSVMFIAPDNNSVIAEGSDIVFAVSASDNGTAAAKVEFRVDDTPIGTQTAPAPTDGGQAPQASFTARQPWKASGVQGHLVEAVASRTDGTPIGSVKITLQVVAATTPTATQAPTQAATTAATITQQQPTAQPATSTTATIAPTTASGAAGGDGQQSAPTATSAPSGPTLQVTSPNLNIRAGPGTNFPIIGAMKTGDSASIVGRNADRSWWVVVKDQTRGWVISQTTFSQVVGDTASVPLVASPPTPVPTNAPPTNPPAAAATSTTGPVADLVFDSVTLNPSTPTKDQTFTVTVVIRNQGTVDAGTSLLIGVFQPGSEKSPAAVPAIKAGQTATVSMPVTLHSSGANQTATLTLDANNEINEGANGEANNTKTITYNVN